MFWASWVCGPAAGPSGLDARWPWIETDRSRAGSPRKKWRAGRSKAARLSASSRKRRVTRTPKGTGTRSMALLFPDFGTGVERASGIEWNPRK